MHSINLNIKQLGLPIKALINALTVKQLTMMKDIN